MKTVAQPLAASVYVALSRLPYPRLNLECLINPNRKLSIARRPERGISVGLNCMWRRGALENWLADLPGRNDAHDANVRPLYDWVAVISSFQLVGQAGRGGTRTPTGRLIPAHAVNWITFPFAGSMIWSIMFESFSNATRICSSYLCLS